MNYKLWELQWLIKPKLIYLIINLHFYGFHQIRSAFAKEKFKVPDQQYGKMTGYTQFITFITNIFIGNICDKRKNYKNMLLFLIVASTAVFLQFYINGLENLDKSIFWGIMLLYMIFNNPKQPLTDKIMISYLEKESIYGSKVYGRQRLWGTFSLSIATYFCEWLCKESNGILNFNNLIGYNIVTTVLAYLLITFAVQNKKPDENVVEEKPVEEIKNTVNRTGNVFQLLKNWEFMFFILIIFSNAITRSALTIYLNIFHKEILNIQPYDLPKSLPLGSNSILSVLNNNPIATLTTFGIVLEVAVLFFSEQIIDRLGYFWPLIIAQLVSIIRFLAYYLIPSTSKHVYGLSCIFELLRGVYFGLIHISSVHIAPGLAPSHLKATSQMIYQGTFSALGSLVSGYIFGDMFKDKISDSSILEREAVYKQIFLINTIISCITILVCFIKYGIKDRVLFDRCKEDEKLNGHRVESNC